MTRDAFQIDLRYVAGLARLELTEEDIATFEPQLEDILRYVKKLGEIDVSGIEPTAHANPVLNVMRPDESRPSMAAEQALANGPKRSRDQFVVPKVVD